MSGNAVRAKRTKKKTAEAERCPFCTQSVDGDLAVHIRRAHGEDHFRKAVLDAKARGTPDAEIGARFGISFRQLERIITEAYGANISILERPKRIKSWVPKNFREETTSVWSFKQRGSWATHDGRYRGNWSPYIPRNVILKYSRPGDVVLDYFVGGGTTAVEAKLLGRRCIARDINPGAIQLTLENFAFATPLDLFGQPIYQPEVSVGDARDLADIPDDGIDLICAHPPYAGIINYSSAVESDLSKLRTTDFLAEMSKVARESLRVLKPGGKCAILIGDGRKSKHVIPIGFQTMRVFLDAGFVLRELVIKRQHNCKTTGFWYTRSLQYNFLLLAHEYLPIFEKPTASSITERRSLDGFSLSYRTTTIGHARKAEEESLETTTVWIFPLDHLEAEIRRNLLQRFSHPDNAFTEIELGDGDALSGALADNVSLIYIRWPKQGLTDRTLVAYRAAVGELAERAEGLLPQGGFFVLEAQDFRVGEKLWPTGLLLYEDMTNRSDLALKEIVVVVPEESPRDHTGDHLEISHRHLLIYARR